VLHADQAGPGINTAKKYDRQVLDIISQQAGADTNQVIATFIEVGVMLRIRSAQVAGKVVGGHERKISKISDADTAQVAV
jgi:hypothetical protein